MILSSVFLVFITAFFAAAATFNDLPPEIVVHHAAHLVEGRHDNVTWEELYRFKSYAEYVRAAYCPVVPGGKVLCEDDICSSKNATYSDVLIKDLPGFIAIDHAREEIIISFRGTNSRAEMRDNLINVILRDWSGGGDCRGCAVHDGWQIAEKKFHGQVTEEVSRLILQHPGYRIMAVGHSRGGALATILAARLRVKLGISVTTYTYGAPRVGNEAFARFVSNQGDRNYRITHFNDPVPFLPFYFLNYLHVEPEYWLEKGPSNRTDYEPEDVNKCDDWTENSCIEAFVETTWCKRSTWPSHSYYLTNITQCSPHHGAFWGVDEVFRNGTEGDDFLVYLRNGFTEDIKYAASLHNHSLLADYKWPKMCWPDH